MPSVKGVSSDREVHLSRVLSLPALVFFGLAYMVPLTVFTTYGVVAQETNSHVAAAYIVTLIAMSFTAYSYGHMVRAYPIAGSAYTYARGAFGGHIGFMVGWALMLDYIFLPMINYLVIGIYLAEYFPAIARPIWILGTIGLVTVLNIIGIKMVSRLNMIIVAAQLVFITVFVVIALRFAGADSASNIFAPFYSEDMQFNTIMAGAAILCLSFLGFDAVSTLSEETDNPKQKIPRAILLCTAAAGVLFAMISWAAHMITPDWRVFSDVDAAATDVMRAAGGHFMITFFLATYITGAFASAMASQASVSRILYVMGRDKVLPKSFFGYLSPRFATPVYAILLVSAFSLTALFLSVSIAATMISFGALVAFTFVNLSVIKHYAIDTHCHGAGDVVRFVACPAIGFLLTLWLWTSLSHVTFVVGLSWVGVGFAYLVYLTHVFHKPVPKLHLIEDAG